MSKTPKKPKVKFKNTRSSKSTNLSGFIDDSKVAKVTKDAVKDVKSKTEDFVKGEDQAPSSEKPKKSNAKSLSYQRKKVLSEGKKFVYPLRHTQHKIAIISTGIGAFLLIGLGLVGYLSLYRGQATGNLFYRLTEIFPLPVAKVDDQRVEYEEYLFELKQMTYFVKNHEKVNFSSDEGQQQLNALKLQAREKVIENTVTRNLADKFDIEVSEEEIDAEVEVFRRQNGVVEEDEGQSDKLAQTLQEFFDWDIDDFRRELKLQIQQQKIIPFLQPAVQQRADKALKELDSGTEFGAVAQKYTDDGGTKPTGGEFPEPLTEDNSDLPTVLVQTGFGLAEGDYSDIVQSVFETNEGRNAVALHIVSNNKDVDSTSKKIAHIMFLYNSFDNLAKDEIEAASNGANFYIDFEESNADSSVVDETLEEPTGSN